MVNEHAPSVCEDCGRLRGYRWQRHRCWAHQSVDADDWECTELTFKRLQLRLSELENKLELIRGLVEKNGCDCDCEHHSEEHSEDCQLCLACRIGNAFLGLAKQLQQLEKVLSDSLWNADDCQTRWQRIS